MIKAKDRRGRFRDAKSLTHYVEQLRQAPVVLYDDATDKETTIAEPVAIIGDPTETGEQKTIVSPHPMVERKRVRVAILVPLIVSALGYGGLHYAERIINGEPTRDLGKVPDQSAQLALPAPDPVAIDPSAATHPSSSPAPQDVIDALAWLGHQSREDFRLTAPPKDNAHYYFSKLMQVAPNSLVGSREYAKIAERFAMLAENNDQKAIDYIAIGLQIDPDNAALQSLHALAGSKKGMLGSLFK